MGCRCGSPEVAGCQCSYESGECIEFTGMGTADDPIVPVPILDPDAENLMECGPAGLGAFLPPEIANPPSVRAYRTVSQTIPHNTSTILLFNEERWDTDSMHDNSTNNSRITINTAGVYVITVGVRWQGNATGERRITIRIDGADIIASDERPVGLADDFDQVVATQYKLSAGQYIEAYVVQSSGGNLQVLSEPNHSPEFAATRIAVG